MQKARSHPRTNRSSSQAPTACMHKVSGSISLAVRRSFHRSLTVLCAIGHELVFSLGGWSPQIQPEFPVIRPTRVPCRLSTLLSHTGLSPSPVRLSRRVPLAFRSGSAGPHNPHKGYPPWVWALPVSLAATSGISFDFSSSRYLDVSVPWVGAALAVTRYYPCSVSPFGHPRIDARLQLPEAFRSLPRPSSPAHA